MTGDVGLWLPSGDLKIIDRKKNLFKLSHGEYIRPEYIEGVYKQCRFVANIFVHGTSLENYLVAVVVPNMETLSAWASQNGVSPITADALAANPRVKTHIMRSMQAAAEQEKLRGFEVVKDIALVWNDFSVDNGLLTPTFKLKRHECVKRFAPLLSEMYARNNAASTSAAVAASSPAPRSKL